MSPDDRRRPRRDCEPIVDLASRRQAVPAVPDPAIGGSLRYDPASLERPTIERQRISTIPARLTPASIRLLATAIGDLAERMGGSLTAAPSFDPAYFDDGTATVALVLTFKVAALNAVAADPDPAPVR